MILLSGLRVGVESDAMVGREEPEDTLSGTSCPGFEALQENVFCASYCVAAPVGRKPCPVEGSCQACDEPDT